MNCFFFYLKDLNKKFLIRNLKKFKEHINIHHNNGDSIHEQDGLVFRIDISFRNKIDSYE